MLHDRHNLPAKYFKVVAKKQKQYFQEVMETLSDSLGDAVSRDKLIAGTFTLFGMLNWMYAWYDPNRTLRAEEVADIIYNIFTSGIESLRKSG